VPSSEPKPVTESSVDASALSMTAQQKLAAAIRQHKRQLDIEFEKRVRDECMAHLDIIF